MIMKIRGDHKGRDEGFTLIELMVVVLIIAILIAIAIPTFLGARRRAQNRAAQSNIRNALTSEKTYYTDYQYYTTDNTALKAIESSLNWTTSAPVVGTKDVQVQLGNVSVQATVTNGIVDLESFAGSGCGFALKDIAAGQNANTYFFGAVGTPVGNTTDDTSGSPSGNFPAC